MFGFRVKYLRGSITAADVRTGNDKDEVEWPPHPDRLFCALVQAWGDLGAIDAARSALLWLEALPLPLTRCGKILTTSAVPRFVPVNDIWSLITTDSKGERSASP
jgi:CRISPR-associated protein Csb2